LRRALFYGIPWSDENIDIPGQRNTPMMHADSSWWVYICSKSDKLYVGITTDLEHRMKQHAGSELLYREGPFTESEAADRERQLKGWNRGKKLRLLQNGPGMFV
jgi:putative endonuclease